MQSVQHKHRVVDVRAQLLEVLDRASEQELGEDVRDYENAANRQNREQEIGELPALCLLLVVEGYRVRQSVVGTVNGGQVGQKAHCEDQVVNLRHVFVVLVVPDEEHKLDEPAHVAVEEADEHLVDPELALQVLQLILKNLGKKDGLQSCRKNL